MEMTCLARRVVLGMAGALPAITALGAHAQAIPTATVRLAYVAGGVSYSIFQPDYQQNTMKGITGYVDVATSSHWSVEMETHHLIYDGPGNMSEITYLIGPRYRLHYGFIEPYAKTMVGGAAFNYPSPLTQPQGKFLAIAYGGGVDVPMGSRFILRLVDFEYQQWPGFAANSLTPYGVSFGGSFKFWKGTR